MKYYSANNPKGFTLAVEGKIGCRELVVTNAAWADFVFEKKYLISEATLILYPFL